MFIVYLRNLRKKYFKKYYWKNTNMHKFITSKNETVITKKLLINLSAY